MFESRWQRVPVLLVAPAVAVVALAGCASSSGHGASASSAKSAGVTAQTSSFSAAKLRGALLTKVNGVTASGPLTAGTYSTLPGMKPTTKGVTVNPKACANDSTAGFNPSDVQSAPAASVTFKVGGNGVSEVLLSPSGAAAASALEQKIPAECARYSATVGGKTYHYAITDSQVSGIGQRARVINVKIAGYPADDVWSVLYRGSGFMGAVTVVGPNASETAVRQLGAQSYSYAVKALS